MIAVLRGYRRTIKKINEGVLHVVERGDGYTTVTDLAVDVGPLVRILAVQRHAVERDRESLGIRMLRQEVEPPVGALW